MKTALMMVMLVMAAALAAAAPAPVERVGGAPPSPPDGPFHFVCQPWLNSTTVPSDVRKHNVLNYNVRHFAEADTGGVLTGSFVLPRHDNDVFCRLNLGSGFVRVLLDFVTFETEHNYDFFYVAPDELPRTASDVLVFFHGNGYMITASDVASVPPTDPETAPPTPPPSNSPPRSESQSASESESESATPTQSPPLRRRAIAPRRGEPGYGDGSSSASGSGSGSGFGGDDSSAGSSSDSESSGDDPVEVRDPRLDLTYEIDVNPDDITVLIFQSDGSVVRDGFVVNFTMVLPTTPSQSQSPTKSPLQSNPPSPSPRESAPQTQTETASPKPGKSKGGDSNNAAIIGGTVGGVAGAAILGGGLFLYRRGGGFAKMFEMK